MASIYELRDLADYDINHLRRTNTLPDLKEMSMYRNSNAEPGFFLNSMVTGLSPDTMNLKKNFLDLARSKAELMLKVTAAADLPRESLRATTIWGPIQQVFKNIKHFFEDLKDKTGDKVQEFKKQLESAINVIRKQVGNCNVNRESILNTLSTKEALAVLDPNNFQQHHAAKTNKLLTIVENINSIGRKHSDKGLNEPENLVTNLVEIGSIENDLDSCIRQLVA